MKKGVKRLGIAMLVIAFLAVSSVAFAAATQQPGTVIKPDYTTFSLFPPIEGFDYPPVHFYVWGTGGLFSNPISMVASWILMLGTVLLRLGIMLLDLGMHPTFLNAPIEKIAERMQEKGWPFVHLMMPIIVLGAFFIFAKDYIKGAVGTSVRRFVIIGITLAIIGISFAAPTTTVVKTLTAVGEFGNWIATKVVLVFADEENKAPGTPASTRDSSNRYLYEESWELLVYQPYAIGQIADANIKITKDEIEKVNKIISPYQAVAGQRWGDVMLWFSSKSDEREDLLDYYAERYESNYDFADDGFFRCLIALFQVIVAIFALLFFAIIGAILICLGVYLLGLLVAAIIVLPLSLIPSQDIAVLRYLTRIAGIFMAIIFINLYVAVVFIVSHLITANDGSSKYSFLGGMFLLALVFIAATVMFFVILMKMQGVGALKPMNDVMNPIARRGQRMFDRVKRRRKRNKGRYADEDDDDDEYDDEDEEEDDRPSRGSSSRQSRNRGRNDRADAPAANDSDSGRRSSGTRGDRANPPAEQMAARETKERRKDMPVKLALQHNGGENERPENSSRDRAGASVESAGGPVGRVETKPVEPAGSSAPAKRNTDRYAGSGNEQSEASAQGGLSGGMNSREAEREQHGSTEANVTAKPATADRVDANPDTSKGFESKVAAEAIAAAANSPSVRIALAESEQNAIHKAREIERVERLYGDQEGESTRTKGNPSEPVTAIQASDGGGKKELSKDRVDSSVEAKVRNPEGGSQKEASNDRGKSSSDQSQSGTSKVSSSASEELENQNEVAATTETPRVTSTTKEAPGGDVQVRNNSSRPSDASQSPTVPTGGSHGVESRHVQGGPQIQPEGTPGQAAQPVGKEPTVSNAKTDEDSAGIPQGTPGGRAGVSRRQKAEKKSEAGTGAKTPKTGVNNKKQTSDKT
ncbi:hypothetical protein [Cohnella soli]|uniref:YtxH domain-containing protein n=1 Tax=Cohnella soli TaxID=425005 RepID=A0ABW0HRX7_9BACL